MSRRSATIPPDYFDALYTAKPDPWAFRTSDYERAKYSDTLAILPRDRYADALEVGCSIAVFTRALAARCDRLLAVDASAVALAAAQEACADLPNVAFERRVLPDDGPAGRYDLIMLSEVLYYLTAADVRRTATLCRPRLAGQGDVVLCHWLGETDYPMTGEEAADAFITASGLRHDRTVRREHYRLDLLRADAS